MATRHVMAVDKSTASITFVCGWRSKPTLSTAERIKEALKDIDANDMVKSWFAALLANTRTITVDYGSEEPTGAFEDMERYITWLDANLYTVDSDGEWLDVVADPEMIRESWSKFNRWVAEPIQEEWAAGYTKAQQILPGKREFLPDSMLTVTELTDPDFLAKRSKR